MEVGCLRHPGPTTIGNQLQDGDRTDGWLAKPDNPAMSPHALDKTGTSHTDTQWKAKGGEEREQKLLNAPHIPHIMLLLPDPLINKPYSPEHEKFHACACILVPLTN